MSERTRPWLLGLTAALALGGLLGVLLGPERPAGAQATRLAAIPAPLEPFQVTGFTSSGDTLTLDPPVPPGKVFVVESLFAQVFVPNGQDAFLAVGPPDGTLPIPVSRQAAVGGADVFSPSPSTTRFYVPAGEVHVVFAAGNGGPSAVGITVVGHLVPAP